jgi:hypothetical protein
MQNPLKISRDLDLTAAQQEKLEQLIKQAIAQSPPSPCGGCRGSNQACEILEVFIAAALLVWLTRMIVKWVAFE